MSIETRKPHSARPSGTSGGAVSFCMPLLPALALLACSGNAANDELALEDETVMLAGDLEREEEMALTDEPTAEPIDPGAASDLVEKHAREIGLCFGGIGEFCIDGELFGSGGVRSSHMRVFACDLKADGKGIRTEYSTVGRPRSGPGFDTVGDGNGSRAGCGEEASYDGTAITRFRVCDASNFCTAWRSS